MSYLEPLTAKQLKKLTADQTVERLAAVRALIDAGERLRPELNALYVHGDAKGIPAIDMARAMRPGEDVTYLAETVRQVIGEATGRRKPRRRGRSAA